MGQIRSGIHREGSARIQRMQSINQLQVLLAGDATHARIVKVPLSLLLVFEHRRVCLEAAAVNYRFQGEAREGCQSRFLSDKACTGRQRPES